MTLTEPPAGYAGGGDVVPVAGAVPPPVPKPVPVPVSVPVSSPSMPPAPVPKPTPALRAAYETARRRQQDDPAGYAGTLPEVAPLAGDPGQRDVFLQRRYELQRDFEPGSPRVFTRQEASALARALNGAPERDGALDQLTRLTAGVPATAVAQELRAAGLAPELGAALVLARDPVRARLAAGITAHADAEPDDTVRQRFADTFAASPQGRALEAALTAADEDRRADLEGLRAAVLETGARCTAGLTRSHGPEGAALHARSQCLAPALDAFAEAFGVEPAVFQAPAPQAEPSIAGTEIPEAVIARDAEAHRLREAAWARVAELHDAEPAPFQAEAGRVRDLLVGDGSAAARKAAIREVLALTGPDALPGASDSGRFYLNREAASLIDRIEAGELSPEAAQAAFDAILQEVRDNYAAVNEIGGILLDFVPVIGDVKGLYEAAESLQEAVELLRKGRYTAAGIALSGVAAGAIGLIPGVGDAARIAISRLQKLARRRVRKGADDVGEGAARRDDEAAPAGRRAEEAPADALVPEDASGLPRRNAETERFVEKIDVRELPTRIEFTSGSQGRKIVLEADPTRTTTVLGRYETDMKEVIRTAGYPRTRDAGAKQGSFNMLHNPDADYVDAEQFWEQWNKPFLDAAIERGDRIALVTPPNWQFMLRSHNSAGTRRLNGFGREIEYLRENGYRYNPETMEMYKP